MARIKKLIKDAEKDIFGTMGKEEYAYYVNLYTDINRNLNYPLGKGRGKSKKNIDYIIQQAVERCGYTDFYSIQNTNDKNNNQNNILGKQTIN